MSSRSSGSVIDLSPSRTTGRSNRVSSVPRVYGSNDATPSSTRRAALTDRLRSASAAKSRTARVSPDTKATSIADRYSPSARERKTGAPVPPVSGSGTARRTPERPGQARKTARESLAGQANRARQAPGSERKAKSPANARRNQTGKGVAAAKTRDMKDLRTRYNRAVAKDPKVRQRVNGSTRAVAAATDYALRRGLAANPLTRAMVGAGGGRWGGYNCGNWNNWYWNCCYPSWCWSAFNCCSWWYPCNRWGWGGGWGWGGSWGWSSWCFWPTYAYCSPAVYYEYVEVPIYVEAEEEPVVEESTVPVGDPAAASEELMKRAAAEYMALGDRAFVEGRYGDAAHYYAKAIEYSPEDGVLYLVLSDALFATGDYHYAAFAVRRSLEFNPELAALSIDKHDFYGEPADFDRQLELLERYLADHFLDEDARLVLAANYHFAAQSERAVELLDSPFSDTVRASEEGQLILAAAVGALARAQ